MNENEIHELIQNMDNDLFEKGLEELVEGMDIDIESISKKAHAKLKKESIKMKKRRFIPVAAAASLVAVLGFSTVYASEISEFLSSFFNKTAVYDTVAEGDAFFLSQPFAIDGGSILNLIFTNDSLVITMDYTLEDDKCPDMEIANSKGNKYEAVGYGHTDKGLMINFMDTEVDELRYAPTEKITFSVGNKDYDITLSKGEPVINNGEIIPARQEEIKIDDSADKDVENIAPINIDWVKIGYQKTDNGFKILTNFDNPDIRLSSIGKPVVENGETSFKNDPSGGILGSGPSSETLPLEGTDSENNTYTFQKDENAVGRPITTFISDVIGDVSVKIPSLLVSYEKECARFPIQIPDINEEQEINKEIDLGIQKMVLQTVKRTSETTVDLVFALNTAGENGVTIRDAHIYTPDVVSGDCKWNNDTATMTLTFDKDIDSADVRISWPVFVINGNWVVDVK